MEHDLYSRDTLGVPSGGALAGPLSHYAPSPIYDDVTTGSAAAGAAGERYRDLDDLLPAAVRAPTPVRDGVASGGAAACSAAELYADLDDLLSSSAPRAASAPASSPHAASPAAGDVAPGEQAPAPSLAPASARSPVKVKMIPEVFKDEQTNAAYRGEPAGWSKVASTAGARFTRVVTRYMGDDEQRQATLRVADGKLRTGAGVLDTIGNSGVGTQLGLGADKSIFAMTPSGELRTAAAWEGHRELAEDGARPLDRTLAMLNHSSLVAESDGAGGRRAGAAAAAGELQVDRGTLQLVTDGSGHYKPDSEMTFQGLSALAGMGVDLHDVALKLTPKGRMNVLAGSPDERFLYAPARELMEHGGAADAEQRMRAARRGRRGELRNVAEARRHRLGYVSQGEVAEPSRVADPRAARDAAFLSSIDLERERLYRDQY
jgi:hypothetical protein